MDDPAAKRLAPHEVNDGYTALVEEHSLAVFRLLHAMVGNLAVAEDLTQDALLRAYEHWHQLRRAESARGWLFSIAVSLARQHLRRQRRWAWLPIEHWHRDDSGYGSASHEPSDDLARRILDKLGRDDRAVLILMGVLDLTAAETAAVLGVRTGAVRKRWQRACARFRAIAQVEDPHAL